MGGKIEVEGAKSIAFSGTIAYDSKRKVKLESSVRLSDGYQVHIIYKNNAVVATYNNFFEAVEAFNSL